MENVTIAAKTLVEHSEEHPLWYNFIVIFWQTSPHQSVQINRCVCINMSQRAAHTQIHSANTVNLQSIKPSRRTSMLHEVLICQYLIRRLKKKQSWCLFVLTRRPHWCITWHVAASKTYHPTPSQILVTLAFTLSCCVLFMWRSYRLFGH